MRGSTARRRAGSRHEALRKARAAPGRRSGATGSPAAVITDVPGVRAGHWTGTNTGVTVVLFPDGSLGSCEVRGGAPATRETALLEPGRTVARVDAIVLTGGSAFGLAAADGVMRALAEHGRGFPTRGGPVPIVPAAAIYDLVGSGGHAAGPRRGPHRARRRGPPPRRPAVPDRPGRRGRGRHASASGGAASTRSPVGSARASARTTATSSWARWRWSTRSAT